MSSSLQLSAGLPPEATIIPENVRWYFSTTSPQVGLDLTGRTGSGRTGSGRTPARGAAPASARLVGSGVTLTLSGISASQSGFYYAEVTVNGTTYRSATLALTVNADIQASRLINLSVRSAAGTGSDTLTVGFVVEGTGGKPLLVRGIGPTLASFGVSGALSDPVLSLYSGSTLHSANDDWSASPDFGDLAASASRLEPRGTRIVADTLER